MSIPSEPASLPQRPAGADDENLGRAAAPSGGDGTFEGSIETNLYPVTVADLKSKRSANPFKGGELRDQLVWLFTIDGKEDRGTIAVYSSFSLHEKSSLLPILAALGKSAPADGESIKRSAYVGAKCKAFAEMKESKNGKSYARITKLVKA